MPNLLLGLFGERSPTKVAATFPSGLAAEHAAAHVLATGALVPGQIRIVGPGEHRVSRGAALGAAVEPETHGIARTLVRAYLILGAAGALLGLLFFVGFLVGGNRAVLSSVEVAGLFMVGLGATFGLFVGSLAVLRPDHAYVITRLRSALGNGQWILVAHPMTQEQIQETASALLERSHCVLRTL